MAKHEHSRYAAGAISATTLGHLLGEASGARAQGVMTWTSNKPLDVRGRADVVTGVSDVAGTYLQMQYNTPRPWKVILGVSQVISGRRYGDGPLPWGIMGVKDISP